MAERKPVVLVGGQLKELPAGDTLPSQAPAAHGHAISDVSGLQTALERQRLGNNDPEAFRRRDLAESLTEWSRK